MNKVITSNLIRIKQYDGYKFADYGEGAVKILKKDGHNFLALYDTKKNELICENDMNSEDIKFDFRKASTICQVIISFKKGIYGIEFDKNSFAAFNRFEEDIRKIIKTTVKEIYYPSTNLHYTGESSEGKLNGQGWEFYDTENPTVKYHGEWEDGLPDGTGTCVSRDCLIKVVINNISSGEPIDCGVLTIKNVGTYDIDFSEFSKDKFDMRDDDFCYQLAEYCVPNVRDRLFKHLSIEDKFDLLWDKMQQLTLRLDESKKKTGMSFW